MKPTYLLVAVLAALMAGTTLASAQRFADDPPGWAFQKRGIIEMNGGDPFHYGHRFYGHRSAYAWAPRRHHRYRHHGWRW
jgi:hypothetical protein